MAFGHLSQSGAQPPARRITAVDVHGVAFAKPPFGKVGFGERGHETVARAFREEFGTGLLDIRPLATLESIHRFAGREVHELVLVYEAAPADPAVWAQQRLLGRRGAVPTSAVWVPTEA